MPRTKNNGTASTSKPQVGKVNGNVGKPNQSVEAIREQYKKEEERQKNNYTKASEEKIQRKLRDLSRNQTSSISTTSATKDTIKGYLTGDIYSNSSNLISASRYLYYRSPIYTRICNTYANMYCLQCRNVSPNYSFVKEMDETKTLKQYNSTLDLLDVFALNNNMQAPLLNMWIEDVSFNLFFHDDTGSTFWRIDPSEAVIDSFYQVDGGTCYGFAIDMSKWRSQYRQQLIEWLGDPLKSMWQEYERTNVKYIHVPAEYSMVLKFRTDVIDAVIPPVLANLSGLANLNDLVDNQANADDLSFYKLIYLPLKVLNGAKMSDDWEITPDLAIDYFKIAATSAIPAGVSSAVIPGDELKTIDFSDNVSEDVNRVEQSQQQILGSSGGVGALLNATKAVNNTALINAALKNESAYVLGSVLPQITAWTNMQLMLNLSNYCHVEYFPVTIFTKDDYAKSLLEANQYSYSYRLAYGTLLGFTERQTMAQLKFENDILGLPNIMKYPLQSSYTQTGESSGEVGRPQTPDDELTPSGERSRNS